MRRARVIALVLALAAALAPAGGCQQPQTPQPVRLRPLASGDAAAAAPMFHIRLVVLSHRMRPDAPVEDIWRLLGTTNMPHEKRALWEVNDLRLGDGARLAADRMNELATQTPDRSAQVKFLYARENFDFAIPAGGERDALDILWTDASGRLIGRRFDKALAQFRCVCRSDPDDPAAVRLALVPEVAYGPEEMRWVQVGPSLTQKMVRATLPLADLAAEVRLAPGRLLVIGGRAPAMLSHGRESMAPTALGLGGAFFHDRRGPDTWSETIILTAERTEPGKVPPGTTVPFMPDLKPAPAAKPAAPAAKPAAPPGRPPGAPPGKAPAPATGQSRPVVRQTGG